MNKERAVERRLLLAVPAVFTHQPTGKGKESSSAGKSAS
jgi:hypothetical protein